MSSKPSHTGVSRLIAALEFIDRLEIEIADLQPKVDRLEEAKRLHASARQDVINQLRSMDCESNGNYGWTDRLTWMLREMLRQAKELHHADE